MDRIRIHLGSRIRTRERILGPSPRRNTDNPTLISPHPQENINTKKLGEKDFYVTSGGDVAFEISGSGLWGPIRGIVAVLPDMKTIKGITIIYQEETPGLGGRIGEDGRKDNRSKLSCHRDS